MCGASLPPSSPLLSACRKHCELEKDPRRMTSVLMSVLEQIKVGGARRCGHVGGAGYVLVHVYLQSSPSLSSLPYSTQHFPNLVQLLCTSPSPPSPSPLTLPSTALPSPSISPSLYSPPLPSPSPLSPLPYFPSLLLPRITTHLVPSWNQSQSRTLRATHKLSSTPLVSRPVHTSPATPTHTHHTHHAQPHPPHPPRPTTPTTPTTPALCTCIQCKWHSAQVVRSTPLPLLLAS